MLEVFKYEKRYKYPHMKPNDVAIWERFIDKYPELYDTVQYDFSVGDIPPHMEQTSSPQGQAMRELYKLKIDVLAFKNGVIDLIEVKQDATPASIGQVLGYIELYKRDHNPAQQINPVLITNTLRPNMDFLTAQQGVRLYVV